MLEGGKSWDEIHYRKRGARTAGGQRSCNFKWGGGLTMETLITKVSSEQRLEGNRGPVSIISFFKKQMEEAGKQTPLIPAGLL